MTFRKLLLAGGLASLMASTAYASVIDRPFFRVLGVVVVWGGDNFADAGGTAPVVSDFVLLTPASGSAGVDLIGGDVYSVVTGTLDPIRSDASSDPAIDPITGTGAGAYSDDNANGILDAGDSMTAFGLDGTSTLNVNSDMDPHLSSFYVASNAAFDIYAQATNFSATQDFGTTGLNLTTENVAYDLAVSTTSSGGDPANFAASANAPATVGTVEATVTSLNDIDDGIDVKVFDGLERTAASNGSIIQQSVRFDATYSLDFDLTTDGIQGYDMASGVGTVSADVTYTVYVP